MAKSNPSDCKLKMNGARLIAFLAITLSDFCPNTFLTPSLVRTNGITKSQ